MTPEKSKGQRIVSKPPGTRSEPAPPPPTLPPIDLNFKEGVVVRPGDTLVISAFVYGDDEKLREIADLLIKLIPDGAKVIILDAANTQHIGVIRKQED